MLRNNLKPLFITSFKNLTSGERQAPVKNHCWNVGDLFQVQLVLEDFVFCFIPMQEKEPIY